MTEPLRITFARWCRQARIDLDITQQELASAIGVSRSLIASFESGRAHPSLEAVDAVGRALGVDFELVGRRALVIGEPRQRDLVHARCSGYAHRRLGVLGFDTVREVEVVHGRSHGWIDLLAFDHRTGVLLVIEVKTSLDDLGSIERQIGWYERAAVAIATDRGWNPTSIHGWMLVLATSDVDAAIRGQRDVLARAFPMRAPAMRTVLSGAPVAVGVAGSHRGLALIDPVSRRRDWLLPSRTDGRRSDAPYRSLADATRRICSSPRG